eukprot:TRINITY_DN10648_c0_g1_i2.p1 TRINITY_DN10648_c0_g1~~TRINITY_DN10648_c0_g1_i2.p1  ORF type:complete len:174 (-),score=33.83 TRINITY_DN10648_c0_g1_i2:596-1117(-)
MMFLFLFLLILHVSGERLAQRWDDTPPVVDQQDREYQRHAKHNYRRSDTDSVSRGIVYACAICQTIVMVGRAAIRTRATEATIKDLLLATCDKTKPKGVDASDAKRVCVRVIQENLAFVLDGLSIGEDYNHLCQKTSPPLCKGTHEDFLSTAGKHAKETTKREGKKVPSRDEM